MVGLFGSLCGHISICISTERYITKFSDDIDKQPDYLFRPCFYFCKMISEKFISGSLFGLLLLYFLIWGLCMLPYRINLLTISILFVTYADMHSIIVVNIKVGSVIWKWLSPVCVFSLPLLHLLNLGEGELQSSILICIALSKFLWVMTYDARLSWHSIKWRNFHQNLDLPKTNEQHSPVLMVEDLKQLTKRGLSGMN